MNSNQNNNQDRRDLLLPPPELLQEYERISKGLSKNLVELIKNEQDHRHRLQKIYLLHFRLGQLIGAGFFFYTTYKIFELAKIGQTNLAYTFAGIFSFLIILVIHEFRKDRTSSIIRNTNKKLNNYRNNNYNNYNNYNNNRKSYPHNHNN